MAFESWLYGDPEKVAMRKQAEKERQDRNCGACGHRVTMVWKGETISACSFKKRTYGDRRCDKFTTVNQIKMEDSCK